MSDSGGSSRSDRKDEADAGGRDRLVQEGLGHLQSAAREAIAAARALLDVAEELVADPKAAEALLSTIGSLAEAAVRSSPARTMFGGPPAPPDEDDGGGGVQRIPVS